MALDETLLDSVSESPTSAVFRTYEWSEPTLSLGYFQDRSQVESDVRWRDVPIVRRATGGGAIWHHHELTYAVVLPRSHPLGARPPLLYRAVHDEITKLLQMHGASVLRRGEEAVRPPKPFLCFLDRDPEDLILGDSKVVGSAQRRRPGSVLQHGSILLARSARTPELPGLFELAGLDPGAGYWANRLTEAMLHGLGMTPRFDQPTSVEQARAQEIEADRYRNPAWCCRR